MRRSSNRCTSCTGSRNGKSRGGRRGSSRSSNETTQSPPNQLIAALAATMLSPDAADTGRTAPGVVPSRSRKSRTSRSTRRKAFSSNPARSIFVTRTETWEIPISESKWACLRVCSLTPSTTSITSNAASASAAPVTMFLRNSRWPGASTITQSRLSVRKRMRETSMVTPWSRSACRASSRNAHSTPRPRRSLARRTAAIRSSETAPVSCSRRPIRVDLP